MGRYARNLHTARATRVDGPTAPKARWWVTFVALVVVVAVAMGTITVLEQRRAQDWETVLRAYVRDQPGTKAVTVLATAKAVNPAAFAAEMGEPDRGSSGIWAGVDLTYPPTDVYCAILDRGGTHQLVFVTRHSDGLYRTGWIVHRGPIMLTPADFAEQTEALGCALQRQQPENQTP